MLGLGNSIIGGGVNDRLLGTYTSDFSSGVDGWTDLAVEGTLTLTGGNNRPGGSGDPNWLKGAFDTNQSGYGGIMKNNLSPSWTRTNSDYFTISYKIWLHNVSGEDWGGTDTVHTVSSVGYWTGSTVAPSSSVGDHGVTQDEEYTVSKNGSKAIGHAAYQTVHIYWTLTGDTPLADAEFYIKDVVVKFYGLG